MKGQCDRLPRVQVFYPDAFNGCFAGAPDPIDFRSISTSNLYDDPNIYYVTPPAGAFAAPSSGDLMGAGQLLQPDNRNSLGQIRGSVRDRPRGSGAPKPFLGPEK